MKYEHVAPPLETRELFVRCSSFPPFVWEVKERAYPNREIAAGRDVEALKAAIRLYYVGDERTVAT